jgi:hypothetical protein
MINRIRDAARPLPTRKAEIHDVPNVVVGKHAGGRPREDRLEHTAHAWLAQALREAVEMGVVSRD